MLTDTAYAAAFEAVTGRPGTAVDRARFASATLDEYAACLRRFTAWLAGRGLAMPTDAATVCAFLEELAGAGLVPQTIRKYAAAISIAHQHRGAAFEWRALKETLGKVARMSWHVPRQARPLLADELQAILAGLVPTRVIDLRDAALLSVGWSAMLRRAELVGLDWHRRGDGQGFARIEHGGIVIVLAKSKTKQHAAVRLHVGPADMPAAIAALQAWVDLAKPRPGEALFRAVRGRAVGAERLAPEEVNRILASAMAVMHPARRECPLVARATPSTIASTRCGGRPTDAEPTPALPTETPRHEASGETAARGAPHTAPCWCAREHGRALRMNRGGGPFNLLDLWPNSARLAVFLRAQNRGQDIFPVNALGTAAQGLGESPAQAPRRAAKMGGIRREKAGGRALAHARDRGALTTP